MLNRRNMSLRQIIDMNIIAHARAVFRVIIAAKNIQFFSPTRRDLGNIWHQIVRNAAWVLANSPAWMRANWVKVPKYRCLELLIGSTDIADDFFDKIFRLAIWVCDSLSYYGTLRIGNRRAAIDSRR